MPLDDYLAGAALFAGTVGASTAVALVVARRWLGHLGGAPRALAIATVATGVIIGVHLAPGIAGVLSAWSALAVALAALALVAVSARRGREGPAGGDPGPKAPAEPAGREGLRSRAAAAAALAGYSACALAAAWQATVLPSQDIDTLTFHLPNVARWIQTGSFWQVDQFTPLLANGNYPHHGDVLVLAGVLPWHNDAFARLVAVPYALLAGLAVYAVAAELRAPRATAALMAVVFSALPVTVFAAYGGAKTDAPLLAAFGAGVLFIVRHARTGRRSDLVLAGLGLGLAFGTKWYGVSSVVAVVAVWLAASMAARRPPRRVLGDGAVVAAVVLAVGGFWLVRNQVVSGNALFPVEVRLLGVTILDAPFDFIRACGGFTVAGYLDAPGVLGRYVLPAFADNYALPGLAVLLGAAAAVAGAMGARSAVARRVLVLAAAAAVLAAVYAVTPYTALGLRGEPILTGANTRYLLPALLVAAAVAAWGVGRLGGRARVIAELLALAAVADGLLRGFEVPLHIVAGAAAVLAVLLCAAAAVRALGTRARRPSRRVVALLATAAVGGLVAVGHVRQREFNAGRYAGGDPVVAWLARHAPAGHRVGLAGVWGAGGLSPVLPAFGPRFDNEVAFIGRFEQGQLREIDDRTRWREQIRRRRVDLLVVGRGGYAAGCPVPGQLSPDDAWARAEGFRPVARSDRLTLYRVDS